MHKDFAEWYRAAGIAPDGEMLPKRWTGIEEYQPGRDETAFLVRLFYRLGRPQEEFLARFRMAFQNADATFPMRGNDQELIVLAGAKLVDLLERAVRNLADTAALAVVCAGAQNLRASPAVAEIPEIAARHLGNRTVSRGSLNNGGGNSTEATPPTDIQVVRLELDVVGEECNMLWWLFSEHSRDLKQPWVTLPAPAVPFIAGKELADLTRVMPGPAAATAFLDRVIRGHKSKHAGMVSVRDAVNGVPIEWRRRYAGAGWPSEIQDILPMSRGLELSLTAPDKNEWLPAFTQGTGISADSKVAPYVLAYQVFLENLLRRAWKA